MAKRETFTQLTAPEATAEATTVLTAAGFTLKSVSSGVGQVGLKGKNYLMTIVNGLEQREDEALAILRDLPDVAYSGIRGRGTVHISRRYS